MVDEFNTAAKKMIEEHGFTIDLWCGEEKYIISYTCHFGKKNMSR